MNHALVGAGIPFLIAFTVYCLHGARAGWRLLMMTPLAMALGIVWALIPDIPLLFGSARWYYRIHQSAWIDVFFWHGRIDQWEQHVELAPWNQAALAVMGIVWLIVAWRELKVEEKAEMLKC